MTGENNKGIEQVRYCTYMFLQNNPSFYPLLPHYCCIIELIRCTTSKCMNISQILNIINRNCQSTSVRVLSFLKSYSPLISPMSY